MSLALTVAAGIALWWSNPVHAADVSGPWASADGHYSVRIESQLEPLVINRIHAWVVSIADEDGNPVGDAQVALAGGMPAHDHGLPTSPMMTDDLGDGRYLVEGIRFHMAGAWRLELVITAADVEDTVLIEVDL